jgi:uncharacterized caspase-like protein
VNWPVPEGRERQAPTLWILAVGVNHYDATNISDLNYCAADARGIIASFKEQEGRRYTNAFVFTASKGNEYSEEKPELRRGVFTYSVREGLRGAGSSLGMLQLSGEVPRMTEDRRRPSSYSLGLYDFILKRVRRDARKAGVKAAARVRNRGF